ncbi:hypothetical protein AB4114_00100 [Paenibacillus sp. 2RAB27]|uniref:hypothetical protein n=1 Tax=Paenibacillus sp. 2RAB27 TaxID=3232991 RepID=UPI003F96E9FB
MKTRVIKILLTNVIVLVVAAITYRLTDQYLILDKRDQTYGEYDFFTIPIDAEAEVMGTGKQHISDKLVSTRIVIKNVLTMKEGMNLTQGEEIIAYERYDLLSNRYLSPIPFMPGRSITGMGTGYQRLEKNQSGTVKLNFDEKTGRFWIVSVNPK